MDTSPLPLTGGKDHTFYLPPAGIERRGAIGGQPRRRLYHPDRGLAEDTALGRTIDWDGRSLAELLADLMEQHFLQSARGILE